MLGGCDLTEQTQRRAAIVSESPVSPLTENTVANIPLAQALKSNWGGRRPAKFWDDLCAEIAAQLYMGDLKPDTQADIERAMHNWLNGNGFEAADSVVRERASKLMKLIHKKG